MNIRTTTENDAALIADLFTESVHGIASGSYNREQLEAWAPSPPDLEQWRSRLSGMTTLVAESDTDLAGFLSFTSNGHIELLFTSPDFARQGIASELFAVACDMLRDKGIHRFTAAASLEARPFFEHQGFRVVKEDIVTRNGMPLKRFYMEADPAPSARRSPRKRLRY